MRIALTLLLFLSVNAFALGGYSTLQGDNKTVADNIKDKLQISENDAYEILSTYLKEYLTAKSWHYNTYVNSTLKSGKISDSKNKYMMINLTTDDRYINVTLLKYAAEGQIHIQTLETLPRDSSVTISKYNKLKADKDYKVSEDNDSFAIFQKDGFTACIKTLVHSGSGGIQYSYLYVYDLKN